ncbi:MAG TPA: tRNA (adenosine(37)-N6)-threonylcarbamoyltransferase complex ATPase subunit type 1 TsaE [Gammaproteobacteria bacterium]|nr:tRNA (adenosine(37)-N6)-threonylcarbamoyltransferase complex ATPase subunit type 1 TsaE [Gammaproteobacteria bacterium]
MPVGVHQVESEHHTHALAAEFLKLLQPGDIVSLLGPLGAGKTTFVRGLLRAFGYLGRVRSPTFTLINQYPTVPPIYHADLYRLFDSDEILALGLDDIRDNGGVLLVEWANHIPEVDAQATWRIVIEPHPDDLERRTIDIQRVRPES